jgi:glutamate racemase
VHIVITDSGVGGLSVCAYAERLARTHGVREPLRLTFANAAPENDYGYNSMPSKDAKVETFDRFLTNVTTRYAPDFIYVACNTLSVLLPDTPYFRNAKTPVKGIVETGAALLMTALERDSKSTAMIFGTQTTIDAGTYPRLLESRGIDSSRIVNQACPRLADTISEDREGARTKSEIAGWVRAAISKMQRRDTPVAALLACTHYGYRKDVFEAALTEAGARATVINPNESAASELFERGPNRDVDVRFVTRYAIPPATIEALTWFLSDISPKTVAAMKNFDLVRDLF